MLGRISQATSAAMRRAASVSGRVARKHGGKIALGGASVGFGSYLVGGRRGRGADKTSGRPTGMYDY